MNTLYLWLNIGSFLIPFVFSFHPKLRFYKRWRSFLIGVIVMMAIFIPWDILFTQRGFWGFNETYLTGYQLLSLPVEEWLFFLCIPYACMFTHYALLVLFPRFGLPEKLSKLLYLTLISVMVVTLWYQYDRWYTLVSFAYAILLLGWVYNYRPTLLPVFFASYLVILLPFFIVNGVLTGSWIEAPVVWYNDAENLGIRLGTIPLEDTVYNLGMLLTVLVVMDSLEQKKVL